MPLVNRVLGAVDGRRVVVAPLGELEEEVHLVGRRLVDEVLVYDEHLVPDVLVENLLLRPAPGRRARGPSSWSPGLV